MWASCRLCGWLGVHNVGESVFLLTTDFLGKGKQEGKNGLKSPLTQENVCSSAGNCMFFVVRLRVLCRKNVGFAGEKRCFLRRKRLLLSRNHAVESVSS